MSKAQTEMNSATPAKKRRDSTLAEKVKILELLQQPKASQSSVARNMGLSQSTISRVMKKRDEILERWNHNENPSRKRNRPFKHAKVDEALLEWLLFAKTKRLPISGPILMRRAEAIAKEIGCTQFKPSNGWLWRWKERYRLFYRAEVPPSDTRQDGEAQGESVKILPDVTEMMQIELNRSTEKRYDCYQLVRGNQIMEEKCEPNEQAEHNMQYYEENAQDACFLTQVAEDYSSDNIFCAVGSPFQFRIITNRGNVAGQKKEAVCIWLCCNLNGTERLKLLVTHNLPPRTLGTHSLSPVTLKTSKDGCLTESLFADWLLNWDAKLSQQERNVILAFTAHNSVPKLKLRNISLCILSKDNLTSNQQFGEDLIHEFNEFYRELLHERLEEDTSINRGPDLSHHISNMSLVEASYTMNKAWLRIRPRTIKTCFEKSEGFRMLCFVKHDPLKEDIPFSMMQGDARSIHGSKKTPTSSGAYRRIVIKEEGDVGQEEFGSETACYPIQKVTVGDVLPAGCSEDQSEIGFPNPVPKSGKKISESEIKSENRSSRAHELREACDVIQRFLSSEGQDMSIFNALQSQIQRCLACPNRDKL
ncbi:tigger transposable element-derived protein 4-like [Spea bombifrons]|uniref:tigger transposable element-derived protein 4-like n=1 Tax=Spea bombifrons TaxID=233779 RepID=UPI00234B7425|nr:tigger transposable element-derived protein 4-like [Spea bombifrons]